MYDETDKRSHEFTTRGTKMSQENEAGYVLGHSASEVERLIAQARVYEPLTQRFLLDAGLEAGMRVLDVGCGVGDVTFLAARLVDLGGEVVGIDQSPTAIEAAGRRAQEMAVSNVRFVVGDAGAMPFEEPFDAAIGRCVLQFSSDPPAMMREIATHVRSGGIVAFQEIDWSGCRSLPNLPTFSSCVGWGVEAMRGSGADPYIGLKLHSVYTAAGLPAPALSLRAGIGAGPDQPIYMSIAGLMRSLLPAIERLGIASAEEVDVDTLASRISAEAVAENATVVWVSVVGAATHLP
jgi:SAM-dependent methyltransferase